MKKTFSNNPHFLFYAIYFLGMVGFFIFPTFITLPVVDWILWACLFVGFILHIRIARKDNNPMSRKKKW